MIEQIEAVVAEAGAALLREYTDTARPKNKTEMGTAGSRLDDLVSGILRPALADIRPSARWVDDEQEMTALPPGEWWAVDPIEGGVNYVHGMDEWAVTVALIRDNVSELAVVHRPVGEQTWTAVRGGGAFRNGRGAVGVGEDRPGRGDRHHDPAAHPEPALR